MNEASCAICIGASSGGVRALLRLAAAMPPRFPVPVFVVQHVGANPSILPELMRAEGPNPAVHPSDGEIPVPGTIYVAPPDRHMLVVDGRIRLVRGPKEHHARPAIDPTFRSVAASYRSSAIGVILSGTMDDGTAGLAAIKACGGTAIVQDPEEAEEPGMPRNAMRDVPVDLSLRVGEMVPAWLGRIRNGAVEAPDGSA